MKRFLLYFLFLLFFTSFLLSFSSAVYYSGERKGHRIYIFDMSQSFLPHFPQALEFYGKSLASLDPKDQGSIIVFGETARLEKEKASIQELLQWKGAKNMIPSQNTDIEDALLLAQKISTPKSQILLFTDGNQTRGRAEKAVLSQPLEIWVKTYEPPQKDIQILNISHPSEVFISQKFTVIAEIQNLKYQKRNSLKVQLNWNQRIISKRITFQCPMERILFSITLKKRGFHVFQIELPEIGLKKEFGIWCKGKKNHLLWIARNPPALPLPTFLEMEFQSSQKALSLEKLEDFSLVVLENLPLWELEKEDLTNLENYVGKKGGTLLVLGGPESYSQGG
ncbi:MAG: VWA domain-containing protein, partial [Planctomycetota bacterium]